MLVLDGQNPNASECSAKAKSCRLIDSHGVTLTSIGRAAPVSHCVLRNTPMQADNGAGYT